MMITHKNTSSKINSNPNYTTRAGQRQSIRRVGVILPALLMLLWGLTGCAAAPRTLKIGLVAPFEGAHRPLGYEALFATKLAVQEKNRAGGIQGYQIELVALNDFDDPAEAEAQARALIADPAVLGMVGHLSPETSQAALPIYRQANLAVSLPWPVTAAVLTPAGGAVSVAATTEEATARLEAVLQRQEIESARPPLPLYLAADGIAAAEIILSRAAITAPMAGLVDAGSPQLVQTAKSAANGLIFVSPGPNPVDVHAAAFVEAYQNLAGFPPGPRAALTYDATRILLNAIEQAILTANQYPTRVQVQSAITAQQLPGLTGEIAFAENGQRLKAPVWIYRITAGQYPGELLFKEE